MPKNLSTTRTILDHFGEHVRAKSDQVVFRFLKSENAISSLTYQQLHDRAVAIANLILEYAAPGDRALLTYDPGLDFIEAFLGCLYAGIVAVPAYPPRNNFKAERICSIINDAEPKLVLCTANTLGKQDVVSKDSEQVVLQTDNVRSSEKSRLPSDWSSGTAFLQYTSGSTAAPKGVVISHENIIANQLLIEKQFGFSQSTVSVSWLPTFHDMGLVGMVLPSLFVGFPCVMMAPNTFLFRPVRWLEAVTKYGATCTGGPNFAYDLCVDRITPKQKIKLDLSSLTVAFNGSEPVRAGTLKRFSDKFADCGFRATAFLPCYGLAEATLLVSGGPAQSRPEVISVDEQKLEASFIHETERGVELVGCGQVSPELPVSILNPGNSQASRENEIGEICIFGKSVSKGYFKKERSNLNTIEGGAEVSDQSLFRTGDLGFLRNNELYVTGRLKDLIIIRGRNIYPQDIETVVQNVFELRSPNSVAAFLIETNNIQTVGVVFEASRAIYRLTRSERGNQDAGYREDRENFGERVAVARERIAQTFDVTASHFCVLKPGDFPRTSSGKLMRAKTKRLFLENGFEALDLPMVAQAGAEIQS